MWLLFQALELTSSVALECGDVEAAKQCLGRAVEVQPDEGHEKFMSLAQLFQGKDALNLYDKGIQILAQALDTAKVAKSEANRAHCVLIWYFR